MNNSSCCSSSCCEGAEEIRKVTPTLDSTDFIGAFRVRLGIKRDNYRISPGLYALGNPNDKSHVLVTANYKLTFDSLRKELTNQNLWILVLDTNGINVWCAAGKGTFGTEELINRIKQVKLEQVVSHKKLILPQLGAPGVAAHEVSKNTGFNVIYGPIKAKDIPKFFENNLKATEEMRKVDFTLKDRLTVVPVELNYVFKLIPVIFTLLLLFNLVKTGEINFWNAFYISLVNLIPYIVSTALGTLGIAALLPYIPFRSFALKGLFLGLIWAAIVVKFNDSFQLPENTLMLIAHSLFLISITSFLGLNFTGSTTFTSLSGVQKETLYTIPAIIIASVVSLGLIVTYKVMLF